MSTQDYVGDELSLFAQARNWKNYWSRKLEPFIEGTVLEVGAGIGSNLELLRKDQQPWVALEPDALQADQIRTHYTDTNHDVSVITGTLENVPRKQRFKTILYIDVLEHIEQDRLEILNAFSRLEENGRLIILSPAHDRLYSPFDKAVGHFRRYDKCSLKALTPEHSSAQISALFYLDSIGCLASLANAKLLKSSLPTRKQIRLWDSLMVPVSKIVDPIVAHRIGKTIVMIWRKGPPS